MLLEGGGAFVLLIILVFSIYHIATRFSSYDFGLNQKEKHLFTAFIAFPLVYLINIAIHGTSIAEFDNAARFLLLLPTYFFLRQHLKNCQSLFFAVYFGAVASGAIAIFQTGFLDLERAMGITHPGPFGALAISFGIMCLAIAMMQEGKCIKFLMLTGFGFGIVAGLLSSTRGAWLIAPVGIAFLLITNPMRWSGLARTTVVFVSVLAAIIAFDRVTGIEQRIAKGVDDIELYFTGDDLINPLGLRFEAWRTSINSFLQNPMLGIGEGNFSNNLQELANRGEVAHSVIIKVAHPHNEFISASLHRGIPGLATLLAVMLIPFFSLYRISKKTLISQENRTVALAGTMLILCFGVASLSDVIFGHHNQTLMYVFTILLCYACVFNNKTQDTEHSLHKARNSNPPAAVMGDGKAIST